MTAPRWTWLILTALGLSACARTTAPSGKQLGTVDFTTDANAAAQEHFLRGVLHLHSFGFEEAGAEFQKAQQLDPDFALAYWGEALSYNHPLLPQERDLKGPRDALDRLAPSPEARQAAATSDRDRGYLAAVDVLFGEGTQKERILGYADAMEAFAARFPGDTEVQAFYAVALLSTVRQVGKSWGDPASYRVRMKAAAIAQKIFAENPDHPGAAHYIIHAFDDPIHAPLGLDAAFKYAAIAPGESHPLHMPSHIFIQLGMWEEVVSSNEAAYAAALEDWEIRDELSETARFFADVYAWHALDWGQYGALQLGDFEASERAIELVRPIVGNTSAPRISSGRHREGIEEMIARHIVETERWKILPVTDASTSHELLASGVSAWALDDSETLAAARDELVRLHAGVTAEDSSTPASARIQIETMLRELEGLDHLMNGDTDAAIASLQLAVDLADSLGLPNGAIEPIKPPHELLGEVLLRLGRNEDAANAFRASLERTPNRRLSVRGLAAATAE